MSGEPDEYFVADAIEAIVADLVAGLPGSPVEAIKFGKAEPAKNDATESRIVMWASNDVFGPPLMVGGDQRSVATRQAGIACEIHALAPEGVKGTYTQHLRAGEKILHRLVLAVHCSSVGRYKVAGAEWAQGIKHREHGVTCRVSIIRALDVLDLKYQAVDEANITPALYVAVQEGP